MKRFTLKEFKNNYPNDNACLDKIFQLRYKNLVCPKCESDKPFIRVEGRRSYYCPACAFQIYPTVGTIFEKSTTSLSDWFLIIYMQTVTRNGVSAKEIERTLNVCYKTALRMAHQIKILMANRTIEPLTGVLEGDETFIGGLNKNRHDSKKVPESQGRSCKDKTPVIGVMKRGGNIVAQVVSSTSGSTLKPFIENAIVKDASVLITDEWGGYNSLDKEIKHVVINHNEKEYVRGAFHTNTIEGFWSQLKRTIKGTHIHVSKEHLQKYVDEVNFRYTHRDKQDQMFEITLSQIV
ncbi:MAG TPA: IS1595 family transposase [Chitinophagales bacterium]|nr:IS1595 family transposase [Chitinophagales bacterium]